MASFVPGGTRNTTGPCMPGTGSGVGPCGVEDPGTTGCTGIGGGGGDGTSGLDLLGGGPLGRGGTQVLVVLGGGGGGGLVEGGLMLLLVVWMGTAPFMAFVVCGITRMELVADLARGWDFSTMSWCRRSMRL
jgi:hypothetical protein